MPATMTILAPRTGDTVGLTVTVSVAYAGFTTETLTCTFGGHATTPTPAVSGDGLYTGTATTTSPPPLQAAVASATDTEPVTETDVNVSSGGPPITGVEPVMEVPFKGKKKLKKVKGKVPNGSTATRVVCTVNRVDARDGSMAEVCQGSDSVGKNGQWDVRFDPELELDTEDYIQYFVRSCAFDTDDKPLGCVSTAIEKK